MSSTTENAESCVMVYTNSAISSGLENLLSGKSVPFHESVKVAPGITEVTFILCGFSSSRNVLENPNNANLEIE